MFDHLWQSCCDQFYPFVPANPGLHVGAAPLSERWTGRGHEGAFAALIGSVEAGSSYLRLGSFASGSGGKEGILFNASVSVTGTRWDTMTAIWSSSEPAPSDVGLKVNYYVTEQGNGGGIPRAWVNGYGVGIDNHGTFGTSYGSFQIPTRISPGQTLEVTVSAEHSAGVGFLKDTQGTSFSDLFVLYTIVPVKADGLTEDPRFQLMRGDGNPFANDELWGQTLGTDAGQDEPGTPTRPILPTDETENPDGGQTNIFQGSVMRGRRMFFDPVVATGYEFNVIEGPGVGSILLPDIGDGHYSIDIWDGAAWENIGADVLADQVFELTAIGPDGARRFRVRGIETTAAIDPAGHAFVSGLTFTGSGHLLMTQTSLVPEPGTWALWMTGLAGLALKARRRAAVLHADLAPSRSSQECR